MLRNKFLILVFILVAAASAIFAQCLLPYLLLQETQGRADESDYYKTYYCVV